MNKDKTKLELIIHLFKTLYKEAKEAWLEDNCGEGDERNTANLNSVDCSSSQNIFRQKLGVESILYVDVFN